MTLISPAAAGDSTSPGTNKPATPTDKLNGSDFTTFLRMLTTQLKNQDPLNPMDNTEFAVQLATFSGVEQQVKTNSLLATLQTQLGLTGLAQYAGWVGKDGRASMPVNFAGATVTLHGTADPKATSVELVCRNAQGVEVTRQAVDRSASTFTWSGNTAAGATLPAGRYSFTLENFADGKLIESTPAESYARIVEVRSGTNGPTLLFEGGVEIPVTSVTALRGA